MAKLLNVFIDNRPGRLNSVTKVLTEAKINIIGFTIQDRGDFGLMKLMVDHPKKAYLTLADKGFACALKETLFISIKDKPGNLYKLTSLLLKSKVNIIDAHGFVGVDRKGVCCLEFNSTDTKKITSVLAKNGFSVLDDGELPV
jgi:hypothetical protein